MLLGETTNAVACFPEYLAAARSRVSLFTSFVDVEQNLEEIRGVSESEWDRDIAPLE